MRCAAPALNPFQCDAAHHEADLANSGLIIETPIMLKEDVAELSLRSVNYLMAGALNLS